MGTPSDTPRPQERLTAFGNELIDIHDALREEVARLRGDVDSFLAGRGGERPRGLKAHCLSFCSALTLHHTGEDGGAFPALARAFPELRPTLAKLAEDHELIRGLQHGLEQLLDGIADQPDAAEAQRVGVELDGITAILESHFAYEERAIVAALNELPAEAGTVASLLGGSADAP